MKSAYNARMTHKEIDLVLKHQDNILLVFLRGEINLSTSPMIKQKLEKSHDNRMILNLNHVSYIDSIGLATLYGLLKSTRARGGNLALSQVSFKIKRVFRIVESHAAFQIFPSDDLALKWLQDHKTLSNETPAPNKPLTESLPIHMALLDETTSLYNQSGFITLVDHQLLLSRRRNKNIYVLFANFENLEQIIDGKSEDVRKEALVDMGNLLRKSVHVADVIARIENNLFAIALIECRKRDSQNVRERILQAVEDRNNKDPQLQPFRLSVSVITVRPQNPIDSRQILHNQ